MNLAEKAGRFDEITEYVQRVGEQQPEFSVEECSLLSVATWNVVGTRRAVWRIVTSVEQKEKGKGNVQFHARECVMRVEIQLQKICDGFLAQEDTDLIPATTRLSLAANDSVFQNRALQNLDEVCEMARVAFENVTADRFQRVRRRSLLSCRGET